MTTDLFGIPFERADGTETSLAAFQGKVLLIVNVASKCGLTPQYDALEKIYGEYAERGFTVLGFPANEFGAQEPGSNEEIQSFCRLNYGVTFPVFAKLAVKGQVKGQEQHPLYAFLTGTFPEVSRKGSPIRKVLRKVLYPGSFTGDSGEITWNFEKFLIDKQGSIAARFAPDVVPDDPWVMEAIEALL